MENFAIWVIASLAVFFAIGLTPIKNRRALASLLTASMLIAGALVFTLQPVVNLTFVTTYERCVPIMYQFTPGEVPYVTR